MKECNSLQRIPDIYGYRILFWLPYRPLASYLLLPDAHKAYTRRKVSDEGDSKNAFMAAVVRYVSVSSADWPSSTEDMTTHHLTTFFNPSGARNVPPARGMISLKRTITVRACSPESRKCVNLNNNIRHSDLSTQGKFRAPRVHHTRRHHCGVEQQ